MEKKFKKTNNIGETIIDCEYKNKIYNSICNLNNMEYLPMNLMHLTYYIGHPTGLI